MVAERSFKADIPQRSHKWEAIHLDPWTINLAKLSPLKASQDDSNYECKPFNSYANESIQTVNIPGFEYIFLKPVEESFL